MKNYWNITLKTDSPWRGTLNEIQKAFIEGDGLIHYAHAKEYFDISNATIEVLEIGLFESEKSASKFLDEELKPLVNHIKNPLRRETIYYSASRED